MSYSLIKREWLRYFNGHQFFVVSLIFYLTLFLFFQLVVASQSGPQPQLISPLQLLYSGSTIIILFILFIPVLTYKSIIEERTSGTWDQLLCFGATPGQIIVSKFIVSMLSFTSMLLFSLTLPALMLYVSQIHYMAVFTSYLMMFSLSFFCLALCFFVSVRVHHALLGIISSAVVLMLYWSLPFAQLLTQEESSISFLKFVDMNRMLLRATQGHFIIEDHVYLLTSGLGLLIMASLRLSLTQSHNYVKKMVHYSLVITLLGLSIYCSVFLSKSQKGVFFFSNQSSITLSREYVQALSLYQHHLKVSVVLPKKLELQAYNEARNMIVGFIEKSSLLCHQMQVEVIDPDYDLLKMERIAERSQLSKSKIGGIVIESMNKVQIIPYHQWVTLNTLTHEGRPVRFVEAFHGEQVMVRALNKLNHSTSVKKLLWLTGMGMLSPEEKGRLGGSKFYQILEMHGFELVVANPTKELINPKNYDAVLMLDPQTHILKIQTQIVQTCISEGVPLLIMKGVSHQDPLKEWDVLSEYGINDAGKLIVQKKYTQFDSLAVPISKFNKINFLNNIRDLSLFFEGIKTFKIGANKYPNFKLMPLAMTDSDQKIWGESSIVSTLRNSVQTFNFGDTESPFHVAFMLYETLLAKQIPKLAFLSSRSIIENRFIEEGANQLFVMTLIEQLLGDHEKVLLSPILPKNYRLYINERLNSYNYWISLLVIPFLLSVLLIRKTKQGL